MSSSTKPLRIAIVAGEVSGDLLAADLVKALKQIHPDCVIEGIAGPHMVAAGVKPIYEMEDIVGMMFFNILQELPRILSIRHRFTRYLKQNPPDVFIGVDAPSFNLSIEKKLRAVGVKTVHYIAPKIWASRPWRIHKIVKAVDLMLTIFPFENEVYEKHNVPVKFVGHPLADIIPLDVDAMSAKKELGIAPSTKVIGVLPGSRKQELNNLSQPFFNALRICQQKYPELVFLTPMPTQKRLEQFTALKKKFADDLPITIMLGNSRSVMEASDVVLQAVGTANLEAMLLKKLMVVAFRTSMIDHIIFKLMILCKFISLPNLLANKPLVPELIQHQVTPQNLANHLLERLENPEMTIEVKPAFTEIHHSLRKGASKQAAEAILEII